MKTTEKYAQQEVVAFWKQLSQTGLQQCEQEMVDRYLPESGDLLDLGCGAGRAVLALNKAGYRVTGIDLSLAMLAAGRALAPEARLNGADLLNLPFENRAFKAVLMFFGALQHLPGRVNRRRALAEMARVTQPGGRLILGLDNVAPALLCYGYWLAQKLRRRNPDAPRPLNLPATNGVPSVSDQPLAHYHPTGQADLTLWDRQNRRIHPLIWHTRGLLRTLRWRTWPGLVDTARVLRPAPNGVEPGDTQVAQFAIPATSGYIYYHLYRVEELLEDAFKAGWRLLGYHSGSELAERRLYPDAIRKRDKQLLFAFRLEAV